MGESVPVARKTSPIEQDLQTLREILSAPHPHGDPEQPAVHLFRWRGDPYASVPHDSNGGGYEALRLDSDEFRAWLRRKFLKKTDRPAAAGALRASIASLIDIAIDGPEEQVCRRVGPGELYAYIDLANDDREHIVIENGEWRIAAREPRSNYLRSGTQRKEVPPHFVRTRTMRPLPRPKTHGRIDGENGKPSKGVSEAMAALQKMLKLRSKSDFQLLVTWCVAALTPGGPYPVLAIGGPQGSAKSTLARLLHRLVDPSHAPLRSLPNSEKELFISASNAYLLAFDNVSAIPSRISDSLCKLATGGSLSLRRIGSNSDEIHLEFKQPVILNGIGDLIERPDLADRAIFLNLPAMAPDERLDLRILEYEFNEALPGFFSALVDLAAMASVRVHLVSANGFPRMVEFAKIGLAIENAFGGPDSFTAAYDANRAEASDELFELDPLALGILRILETGSFTGTAEELRNKLHGQGPAVSGRGIPTGLPQLASHLKRITPILESRNVIVHSDRTKTPDRRRIIHIIGDPIA